MPFPNDPNMYLYCGVSALVVVILCCCFHVTELIKLRYLRKLTSADRFSLSGISTEFSKGGSRSSTRRNTVIDTETPRTSAPCSRGGSGNFSIFTVITYASSEGDTRPFEMTTVTSASSLSPNSNGAIAERKRTSLEELLEEISTRDTIEVSGGPNKFNGKVTKEEEVMKPPPYEALFPQL